MPPKKPPAKGKVPPKLKFESGTLLTDSKKKQWSLDKVIGEGGFGLIYAAHPVEDKKQSNHVIKIEPAFNGPLFCEMHYYLKAGKLEDITTFREDRKLGFLGVPHLVSTGMYQRGEDKFRFLVIPKLGNDLYSIWSENNKRFSVKRTMDLASQVLNTLEYIHSKSYVHADVKAGNILSCPKNPKHVYLVDFGLAGKYRLNDNGHIPYRVDPKRKHDGTTEYCSRDAHKGVPPSRRTDIESLLYCMLEWMSGFLPWNSMRSNADKVATEKEKFSKDPKALLKACKLSDLHSNFLPFMEQIFSLGYDEAPKYAEMEKMMRQIGAAVPAEAEPTMNGNNSNLKRLSDAHPEVPAVKKPRKVTKKVEAKPSTSGASSSRPKIPAIQRPPPTPSSEAEVNGSGSGRGRGRGKTTKAAARPKTKKRSPQQRVRTVSAGVQTSPIKSPRLKARVAAAKASAALNGMYSSDEELFDD